MLLKRASVAEMVAVFGLSSWALFRHRRTGSGAGDYRVSQYASLHSCARQSFRLNSSWFFRLRTVRPLRCFSRIHEIWVRFFGSLAGRSAAYTPSDCFETFSVPLAGSRCALESVGQGVLRLPRPADDPQRRGPDQDLQPASVAATKRPTSSACARCTPSWIAPSFRPMAGKTSRPPATFTLTTSRTKPARATRSGPTATASRCRPRGAARRLLDLEPGPRRDERLRCQPATALAAKKARQKPAAAAKSPPPPKARAAPAPAQTLPCSSACSRATPIPPPIPPAPRIHRKKCKRVRGAAPHLNKSKTGPGPLHPIKKCKQLGEPPAPGTKSENGPGPPHPTKVQTVRGAALDPQK